MTCKIKASNYTYRITQGIRFFHRLEYSPSSTAPPIDLSNRLVEGTLKPCFECDVEQINFITTTYDAGNGNGIDSYSLELGASITETMIPGTWVFDVQATDMGNAENVLPLLKGNFIVRPGVTK